MRKSAVLAIVATGALFALGGCGNGQINEDAKQLADLQCKAQKIVAESAKIQQQIEKSPSDQTTVSSLAKMQNESLSLMAESEKVKKNLETRYTTDDDKRKLLEATAEQLKQCQSQ